MTDRVDTIAITCAHDGLAHHVTEGSLTAGQHTGRYEAVCGYLVLAAALAAPIGRCCPECAAVSVATTPGPARQSGWLRWILRAVSRSSVTGR